jgi:hypothetical protein
MATPADLAEELEVVLDYSGIDLEFDVQPGATVGTSSVTFGGTEYIVYTDSVLELIKDANQDDDSEAHYPQKALGPTHRLMSHHDLRHVLNRTIGSYPIDARL